MKNNRPSFPQVYMALALELAKRSTCKRLQVGAVITSTDYRKVLAVGYNGGASGVSQVWEGNQCTGEEGNCQDIHAEQNACINCDTPRGVEKYLVVTHFPCRQCAVCLINLGGIKHVFYKYDYRNMERSMELFERVNISWEKI